MNVALPRPLGGWQSRTTFVLALSASAVGLGNLWRFSYLAGEHGGAPFVITYILCLFLVAVPVLIAEVVIGHHGRGGPVSALYRAADRSLRTRGWAVVGWLACVTGFLILAYYVVVAGWALAYADKMQSGQFAAASAQMVAAHFEQFLAHPAPMFHWQSLFLGIAALAVGLGVSRGLGLLVWIVVPSLMVLLGVLVKFGLDHGDLPAAQEFLFSVQWADFTPRSVLVALGHAFYTLGVGVAAGIAYGAYAPARVPVGRSVVAVAVFDTMISLGAGLAVFPIVFANNMEPSMGPGLMFVSLPYAFGNMLQGELFGTLFFLMVVLAALGSAVAMMEPVVGVLRQQFRLSRFTAVLLLGAGVWMLSMATARSLSAGEGGAWFGNQNLLQVLDAVTADLLLPLVSLLVALFVGWRMRPALLRLELGRESGLFFSLWLGVLRYIALPAIALILLSALLVV